MKRPAYERLPETPFLKVNIRIWGSRRYPWGFDIRILRHRVCWLRKHP